MNPQMDTRRSATSHQHSLNTLALAESISRDELIEVITHLAFYSR
jgi:hypothetical protein